MPTLPDWAIQALQVLSVPLLASLLSGVGVSIAYSPAPAVSTCGRCPGEL